MKPTPEPSAISDALFNTAVSYGIAREIETDEQVAIVRRLAGIPGWPWTATAARDIEAAFAHFKVRKPPAGFAAAVVKRLKRLAA